MTSGNGEQRKRKLDMVSRPRVEASVNPENRIPDTRPPRHHASRPSKAPLGISMLTISADDGITRFSSEQIGLTKRKELAMPRTPNMPRTCRQRTSRPSPGGPERRDRPAWTWTRKHVRPGFAHVAASVSRPRPVDVRGRARFGLGCLTVIHTTARGGCLQHGISTCRMSALA